MGSLPLAACVLSLGLADVGAAQQAAPASFAFDDLILAHAQRNGLDPRLVKAIVATESEFHPPCVSPAGARGLMQLMPETAAELGVPAEALFDPETNIRAGTDYLGLLFRLAWRRYGLEGTRFRDGPAWAKRRVIAAYHGGPRALAGPWSQASRTYVRKVCALRASPATRLRPRR
ncbi:MAG TPA: transglycosylase SLT domain-containing protein, partial [Elusimicrobiota bacterium]|nr:transglycosylase SLT domain-containing protein [Elusimicrobiota bacterium]